MTDQPGADGGDLGARVQPDQPEPEVADQVTHPEATQLSVLPTPRPSRTGIPAADAALDRLDDVHGAADGAGHEGAGPEVDDLARHVDVFEDVHARLQEALGSTDDD